MNKSYIGSLFCANSFNHHHELYTHTIGDEAFLNRKFHNDLDLQVNFLDTINAKRKKIKITPKPVSSEFMIVRIHEFNSMSEFSFSSDSDYIDIKIKNITELELYNHLLNLPTFWKDFYHYFKFPVSESLNLHNKLTAHKLPFLNLLFKLAYFYQPTKKFTFRAIDEKPLSTNLFKKMKEDIIDLADSIIPFDFSARALATHLHMTLPGQSFTLTAAEHANESIPNVHIGIDCDRFSDIFFQLNNFSLEDSEKYLQKQKKSINEYEEEFAKNNQLEYHNHKDLSINLTHENNNHYISFPYELNLISLMLSQHEIERQSTK